MARKLKVAEYAIQSDQITAPLRFAVLADLHTTSYPGEELTGAVAAAKPDALLFPGDLMNRPGDSAETWELLERLSARYPCFYTSGNHEWICRRVEDIKARLRQTGFRVLEGESVPFTGASGGRVTLCGIDDPQCGSVRWNSQLAACAKARGFRLLITHRPERFHRYVAAGFEAVVCGHAHGGQVIIPGLINGLYAPQQGIFPRYAGGLYREGDTAMVVSRGIARNLLPRPFNPPELVVVQLTPRDGRRA